MTQDEIIEMAKEAWISDKEAQLITEFDMAYISCTYLTDLVAFAKLVAAKEREACAKVAICYDSKPWKHTPAYSHVADMVSVEIGKAIRARGQK